MPLAATTRRLATGAGLVALAAALRFYYVWSVKASPSVVYPMVDSRAYHERALAIRSGNWLGEGVFYQDPLYPYFLAGLYALFEPGSPAVLYFQAALDALTVGLVYAIALRVFDGRTALLAGLLAATYKIFLYYDALLLKVPLSLFLVAGALFLCVRADPNRPRSWIPPGAALGLAAWTRGNYLLFLPALGLWMLLAGRGPAPRRLLATGALLVGATLAIAPVTVRNRVVGDDWVLLTSQAGQNFYIGNQRGNDTGRYKVPPFLRGNPAYEQADFRAEAERRTGRAMSPSELSRFWLGETWQEIAADPGHFARHTWKKTRLFLGHFEVPDNQSYYFFREHVSDLLRWPLPVWGALLPLAVCGAVFVRRNRGAQLLALFFATHAISVILTYNMSRYRIPAALPVIVFAAAGALGLLDRLRARRWPAVVAAGVFLAAAYPFVWSDVAEDHFDVYRLNLGARMLDDARETRRAARVLEREGRTDEADALAARAESLRQRAEAQLREGLLLNPHNPVLREQLDKLLAARARELRVRGRPEEALAAARQWAASAPRSADAHALVGAVLLDLGRRDDAESALRRALGLEPGHRRARSALARLREADPR